MKGEHPLKTPVWEALKMSLIAGFIQQQNLDRARIGSDYRHFVMIGSASSTQRRIIQAK